jgi:circadian clock protein KaiB
MTASEPVDAREPRFELTLFVSGASDLSAQAIAEARRLCDSGPGGRGRLSVVDIHGDPASALSRDVIVVPTLFKTWPLPERRYVGDLSRADAVLVALDLPSVEVEA